MTPLGRTESGERASIHRTNENMEKKCRRGRDGTLFTPCLLAAKAEVRSVLAPAAASAAAVEEQVDPEDGLDACASALIAAAAE